MFEPTFDEKFQAAYRQARLRLAEYDVNLPVDVDWERMLQAQPQRVAPLDEIDEWVVIRNLADQPNRPVPAAILDALFQAIMKIRGLHSGYRTTMRMQQWNFDSTAYFNGLRTSQEEETRKILDAARAPQRYVLRVSDTAERAGNANIWQGPRAEHTCQSPTPRGDKEELLRGYLIDNPGSLELRSGMWYKSACNGWPPRYLMLTDDPLPLVEEARINW